MSMRAHVRAPSQAHGPQGEEGEPREEKHVNSAGIGA